MQRNLFTMAKATSKPLIALLIVLIVAGLFLFFRSSNDAEQAEGNGTLPLEPDETDVAILASTMPEDWLRYENAVEDIQVLTPDVEQRIMFYVIDDPADADVSYFATSAYDSEEKTQLLGIYKYQKSTYEFERLYKKSYGDADLIPVWHLVAYDHGELVVLAQDIDDSPGPCTEPFLLGIESDVRGRWLYVFDPSKPEAGFSEYTPAQELLDEATAKQDECLAEIE